MNIGIKWKAKHNNCGALNRVTASSDCIVKVRSASEQWWEYSPYPNRAVYRSLSRNQYQSNHYEQSAWFLGITRNLLQAREKSCVQEAIGFGFVTHWLKNCREILLTNHWASSNGNRNRVITLDNRLKTALRPEFDSRIVRLMRVEFVNRPHSSEGMFTLLLCVLTTTPVNMLFYLLIYSIFCFSSICCYYHYLCPELGLPWVVGTQLQTCRHPVVFPASCWWEQKMDPEEKLIWTASQSRTESLQRKPVSLKLRRLSHQVTHGAVRLYSRSRFFKRLIAPFNG